MEAIFIGFFVVWFSCVALFFTWFLAGYLLYRYITFYPIKEVDKNGRN